MCISSYCTETRLAQGVSLQGRTGVGLAGKPSWGDGGWGWSQVKEWLSQLQKQFQNQNFMRKKRRWSGGHGADNLLEEEGEPLVVGYRGVAVLVHPLEGVGALLGALEGRGQAEPLLGGGGHLDHGAELRLVHLAVTVRVRGLQGSGQGTTGWGKVGWTTPGNTSSWRSKSSCKRRWQCWPPAGASR